MRQIQGLRLRRQGDWISIDVTANSFLHHMVRNIVGLLLTVGQGRAPPERVRQQLESRSRGPGKTTSAAHGLYLWRVEYPEGFNLPKFGASMDSAMIETAVGGGD
jgi:tRNA pseudouridine38-40 synthase